MTDLSKDEVIALARESGLHLPCWEDYQDPKKDTPMSWAILSASGPALERFYELARAPLVAENAALKQDRDEWRESTLMANSNAASEERRRQDMQDQRDTWKRMAAEFQARAEAAEAELAAMKAGEPVGKSPENSLQKVLEDWEKWALSESIDEQNRDLVDALKELRSAFDVEGSALLKVLYAVREYLPPGGISKDDFITKVISIVDPWPFSTSPSPQPSTVKVVREMVEALEAVEALIEHQYTGTRDGMNALQNAADDAYDALQIGQQWLKESNHAER